jgi:hypothetical protein
MKTVIEGVLSGSLPWGLVDVGAALAICALIAGLPATVLGSASTSPRQSHADLRRWHRRLTPQRRGLGERSRNPRRGEGLTGAVIAMFIGLSGRSPALARALTSMHFAARFTWLSGAPAVIAEIAIVLVCALLYRAGRANPVVE